MNKIKLYLRISVDHSDSLYQQPGNLGHFLKGIVTTVNQVHHKTFLLLIVTEVYLFNIYAYYNRSTSRKCQRIYPITQEVSTG